MKTGSESRKEAVRPIPPSSNKSLRIGSWNVRTMYEAGKTLQIQKEMERYRLNILGISETHWIQSGQKRLRTGELLIYSGDSTGPHRKGVAFMISKSAQKTLRGWEAHGARIILASFTTSSKRINMNIIQVYAPTNDADDEDKNSFYNELHDLIDKLPKKDVNILMGDMNAQVGSENEGFEQVMGKHGLGIITDNGERLRNLCAFTSMTIGGTVFPHRRIHQATWVSPDGRTENQIDHICISQKFRRSLKDVRVLRGADVASDHHLLLATFKLKLKKHGAHTNSAGRPKFDVERLNVPQKQQEFRLALTNRFQALQDLEESSVDGMWSNVKEVFAKTCSDVLGPRKQNSKPWISQKSLDKIADRRKKKEELNNSRTRQKRTQAQDDYTKASKAVKESIKEDKTVFLNKLAEEAESAAANGHMRTVYKISKTIAGKQSKSEVPVRDVNGNTIFGKEGQMERWEDHFCKLLNRPMPENRPDILPARIDLPLNVEPPTKEEITTAIKQTKTAKAAGPDGIPPEALKCDVPASVEILFPLFEKIWKEETFPEEWKDGHLIKLPKKGDLSKCENYRGITLLSIPGKILNRIILSRMKDAIDKVLRDQQAGFRKNRSCTDQIAALRIIIEQSAEWNAPLCINFIDFEKAFDSLDRDCLWKLMRHYGIPGKLVNLVKNSYDGTTCQVVHDGDLSKKFEIKTGVRQGCILSPFLFLLAVDWIMKTSTKGRKNGIQWTLWQQLDDLDFADDIALLSHNQHQMQLKTNELNNTAKSIGLKIHPNKSKILNIGTGNSDVSVNNVQLEQVSSFSYLGSVVDSKGGTEADVKARIAKARAAFVQLNKVWKASKLPLKVKLRLFNSNVKSVLLYGCETWRTTDSILKKIQTFINGCLRRILRIRWQDRICTEEVCARAKEEPVEVQIKRRKWRWIGHTLRKPAHSTIRQALKWNPQGARKRGRPQETWRRSVERDMDRMGHSWTELARMAKDRNGWRSLVCGLCSEWG